MYDSGHCRDKRCLCKRRDRECWSCGPLGSGLCTNFRPKISSPISETIDPLPTAHSGSLPQTPNFIWGKIPGEIFTHSITMAHSEIVHWRRNLFSVPSGLVGKEFVKEISILINAIPERNVFEPIAMLAVMTMPSLLLQKPHKTSKAKEHVACLTRGLYLWKAGDLQSLLEEGRDTAAHPVEHTYTSHHTTEKFSRIFTKMVLEGKLKAAIRLLSNFQEEAGVLNLTPSPSQETLY